MFIVWSRITKELPSFSIDCSQLSIPDNITLADSLFYNPNKIDILLGGEFFFNLLTTERIVLGDNLPILQNSKLGWLIASPIPEELIWTNSINCLASHLSCLYLQTENLNESLVKFWEIEDYPNEKAVTLSIEERQCEEYFVNTMSRNASGRFIVRLPFRDNKIKLGESKEIAIKRMNYLERKFKRNHDLFDQYSNFMREYISI